MGRDLLEIGSELSHGGWEFEKSYTFGMTDSRQPLTESAPINRSSALLIGVGLLAAGALFFGLTQLRLRERLEEEVAALQAELATMRHQVAHAASAPSSGLNSSGDDIGAVREELESERARREMAEKEAEVFKKWAEDLEGEVIVAFGKVEEIGGDFADLFKEALAVSEAEENGELDTPENQRRVARFLRDASSFSGLSKAVIEFDGDPVGGGKFFASTYRSVFDLDDQTAATLEGMFQRQIAAAAERDLTLNHMPIIDGLDDAVPIEQQKREAKEWLGQRQDFYRGFREQVRQQIPADKRDLFDQWVEVDGIGFNNITFRGQPIAFTLGGKQTKQ